MAPYSMDLRSRVLRDSEAGMASKEVAAKYSVSRAWVERVKQRRRETGETRPRQPQKFRGRVLAGQEDRLAALITARPDAMLGIAGGAPHPRRVEHRVARGRSLRLHRQKKPYTLTNSGALMWLPRGAGGKTPCRPTMRAATCSSTNPA
jgi:hypothetical protein